MKNRLSMSSLKLIAILLSCGLGFFSSAWAEEPVERTGVFLTNIITPTCDGFDDQLESVGLVIVEGTEYIGETAFYTVAGVGELLLTGDPDNLINEVNGLFKDLGTAAGEITSVALKFGNSQLLSLIIEVLPDGDVTRFIGNVKEFQEKFIVDAAVGVVEEFNPVKIADTIITDFSEIATDIGNVLVNLDDPLSAGNEFLKLNQKWTGVGALTYILTEGDPIAGLKKTVNTLHRQFELVEAVLPVGRIGKGIYKNDAVGKLIIDEGRKKIAGALLDQALKDSIAYINTLPDGNADKKAAAALIATVATTFMAQISDPNFVRSNSRHPIYSAKKTFVKSEWFGDAHNSGGNYDYGFLHPKIENLPGCINLGDFAYKNNDIPYDSLLPVLCNVESGRNIWWSRPVDYKLLWSDACSGATHDRSVWQATCEAGYVSVGFAVGRNGFQKPLPNAMACVKDDGNLVSVSDGHGAKMEALADDSGSGAKMDLALYSRSFLGLNLLYAVNKYTFADPKFLPSVRVIVESSGTPPANDKAHCVNFYSEANHRGWTHEACIENENFTDRDFDKKQNLIGINSQMRKGISSFQCGDKVAAIVVSGSSGREVLDCRWGKFYQDFSLRHGMFALPISSFNGLLSPREIEDKERSALSISALNISQKGLGIGGAGAGVVTTNKESIAEAGSNYFKWGETVLLTATPDSRSIFHKWNGNTGQCDVLLSTCEITIIVGTEMNIRAVFKPKPRLTISPLLANLSVSPKGETCSTANEICSYYSFNETISLSATPGLQQQFSHWEGDPDCSDGVVTMTADVNCRAKFVRSHYNLTIEPNDSYKIESVSSNSIGSILCGDGNSNCSESYSINDPIKFVAIEATPIDGATFIRWDGARDCYDEDEGDGDLLKILLTAGKQDIKCKIVSAIEGTEFALTIENSPGGIIKATAQSDADSTKINNCLDDACSQLYNPNETVQLTAIATRGSRFSGFDTRLGNTTFSGTDEKNTCADGNLKMTENVTCIANFISDVLIVFDSNTSINKENNDYINSVNVIAGINYDFWNVAFPKSAGNSTDPEGERRIEPSADDLSNYGRVLWFSEDHNQNKTGGGDAGLAGPSLEAETDLANYLDDGGCLMLSSAEYFSDRGLTNFAEKYLGVSSINEGNLAATANTNITGTGSNNLTYTFNELGSMRYSESDPGFNNTFERDALVHNANVEGSGVLLKYANGSSAAIGVNNETYRSAFLGFPFLALTNDSKAVMKSFMSFCGQAESDDLLEPNDTFAQANHRQGSVALTGLRILPLNDDYFRWQSDWYADTEFKISFEHSKGDLAIALYDSTFNLIATSQSQESSEQIIIPNVDAGQVFYLRVFGVNEDTVIKDVINAYSLDIFATAPFDRDHDGVADINDPLPADPNEQFDHDGDGIGDNADKDDDNDGLPDEYEIAFGLNPFSSEDALHDKDDDGFTNLQEFFSGSDPSDSTSMPPNVKLSSVALDSSVFTVSAGEQVVLRIVANSNANDFELQELSIIASGDLSEADEINEVRLYIDSNKDGVVAPDELVGTGHYIEDDGTVQFILSPPQVLSQGDTEFIVTYKFNKLNTL